jgi:PAS domain-containing protein
MSDSFKRRRRRSGPGSAGYQAAQLVAADAGRPAGMGRAGIAACGAVAMVAVALLALIWMVTARTVDEQRVEIRERAERVLAGQAATIAETIAHELLVIDQSLTIIQQSWKADSEAINLETWQRTMPALLSVADDLFIADEKHVIRQDILPKAVGQGIGAAYVTFPHGSLEQFQSNGTKDRDSVLLQNESAQPIDARQFLMYIVRPLDHPQGWLVGASYRSEELPKLFANATLGYNAVVALMDTKRGLVQSIVGPAARRPKTDLSQTPLFAAVSRSGAGIWLGDTAIDNVERMHAFHRVGERDMAVVVAANWSEVTVLSDNLAAGARSLALVGSALVLVIAGVVLWELYTLRGNRRQKRVFDRNKSELQRLRGEEAALTARAQLNAARLKIVVDSMTDGIALFDSGLHLVQWNRPFLRGIGIEPSHDMPLDTLLRTQAARGLFGAVADVEAEIARRVAVLRTGDVAGVPQPGPDGETLVLRGLPIPEGGFILLLSGLVVWERPPTGAAAVKVEDVPVAEPLAAAPIEW